MPSPTIATRFPCCLELGDFLVLVLGQHLGKVGLDPEFLCHGSGDFLAVARQHRDLDAIASQPPDRLAAFGTDDVGQRKCRDHVSPIHEVDDRSAPLDRPRV